MKVQKKYKLVKPEKGEENIIYIIVNHNKQTRSVSIEAINTGMFINPIETVLMSDIQLID